MKAVGLEENPNQANEKQIKEKEKQLLSKYKPVISTFLVDRVDLQVIGIYALQSAWFALECPKGICSFRDYWFLYRTNILVLGRNNWIIILSM